MTEQQPLQFNNQSQKEINTPIINGGELAISGPVFEIEPGWGGKLSSWFKSRFQNLVLPFSAIIILMMGLTLYITRVKNTTAPSQTSQIGNVRAPETSFNKTVKKGQGLTHLARQALASYLASTPDSKLTPEHKIYIEDFLQKNTARVTNQKTLKVGEGIEFSATNIEKAIEKSKELKKEDLENLSKYAERVNFI